MKYLFQIIFFFETFILSAQDQLVFNSDHLCGNDTVWVFKPSSYDSLKKYPAVYMLHGWSGDYKSWSGLIDLHKYADDYQFIIICPDGFDSYFLESPIRSDYHYETFFKDELYPEMLKKYAIDSSKIFITGLSMGGEGAMYLFLRNPDLFLSAGSTSGVMDLSHSGYRDKCLSKLLGNYASHHDVFAANSPVNLLGNIKKSGKQIIFDCGRDDHLYQCNNTFKEKCDSLKIDATYIQQPGGHDIQYWKKSIPRHFVFFKMLIEEDVR